MEDKVARGMGDEATLRDASKMASNSHTAMYAAALVAILIVLGFALYSASTNKSPNPPPATTTAQ